MRPRRTRCTEGLKTMAEELECGLRKNVRAGLPWAWGAVPRGEPVPSGELC